MALEPRRKTPEELLREVQAEEAVAGRATTQRRSFSNLFVPGESRNSS
jgi:hypothetical protein